MIIIGAGGFSKEVLEVIFQKEIEQKIAFFDDTEGNNKTLMFDEFLILKSFKEAEIFFEKNNADFTLGVGGTKFREAMYYKFKNINGKPKSIISPLASVGKFGTVLGSGCSIMSGTVITSDVNLGKGVLVNLNCTIGHDTTIGDFVELSPGVHISGNCKIEDFVNIGTNATILPQVKVGYNSVIGAGAVVTQDIPSNSLAIGIPAKVIKKLD